MANVFDLGGSVGRGMQLGQNMQAIRQQNSLADLYRTEGAGIASGDPNALAKLAQIDPMAAFDMRRQSAADARAQQQFDMGMQVDRAQLDELKARGKRAAEEHAAKMTEYQRAQEAQGIRQSLSQAAVAYRQGPEAFGQFVQQNAQAIQGAGIDPSQVTYETFPVIAAGLTGAAEAFEMAETLVPSAPEPADEYGRYVQEQRAAGREPLSRIDYAQAKKGEEVIYGPDGTPILSRGPVGSSAKFTEGQSKDNVYSTRARGALEAFEPVADSYANRGERIAGAVPFGLGREVQSDEFQVAEQAGTEFLQAILRKDTGAAITEQEQRMYGETYLPQPGDGPAVLEAKREARIRAINAIEAGMSPSQILAQGKALLQTEQEYMGGAPADPNNPFLGMSDADFSQVDIGSLTPEQIDQLLEARSQ